MKEYEFFRGLIAALVLEGLRVIITREDVHQDRFRAVVDSMEERGTSSMFPNLFIPSPFTGNFREWDGALFNLIRSGYLEFTDMIFWNVRIKFGREKAEALLAEFDPAVAEEFRVLARVYKES